MRTRRSGLKSFILVQAKTNSIGEIIRVTWIRENGKALACLFVAVLAAYVAAGALVIADGRIFVWSGDTRSLYLNFFIYEGESIRQMLAGLFSGQGLVLPMYDFNMGYGVDTVTAIYGDNCDPLNLLAALCPPEYAEFLYVFLNFMRLEIAAAAFFYYCRRKGNGRGASVAGALLFTFCGYTIYLALIHHPQFANTIMYLPLILAGADKIFEGERPYLFIVAMALQFMTSLYFCYMTCLGLLGYCLLKYFFTVVEKSPKGFAVLVGKFALYLAIGLCVGMVAALPSMMSIIEDSRAGLGRSFYLFEPFGKYFLSAAKLVGATGRSCVAFIGPVGVIAAILFFVGGKRFEKRTHRAWLVAFVIMLVGWFFPVFGRVFNGFGYSTERWMYLFAFCVGYITCLVAPKLRSFTSAEWKKAGVVIAIFAVLVVAPNVFTGTALIGAIGAVVLIASFAAIALVAHKASHRQRLAVVLGCTVAGCAMAGAVFFTPLGTDSVSSYAKAGEAYNEYTVRNPINVAVDYAAADPDYRVSRAEKYTLWNSGVVPNMKSVDFFASLYNQHVDDLRKETGLSEWQSNYHFTGSDLRFAFDMLTGGKYYVCHTNELWKVPFGYEGPIAKQGKYQLYETDRALPVAFSTRKVVDAESYAQLDMVQKTRALLQGCVLQNAYDLGCDAVVPTFDAYEPETQVVASGGIAFGEKDAKVTSGDNDIAFSFAPASGCEVYLVIENLSFEPFDYAEYGEMLAGSAIQKTLKLLTYNPPGNCEFRVKAGDRVETYRLSTDRDAEFSGKKNWVINLGYFSEPVSELHLSFVDAGNYAYDSVRVVCQPVDGMAKDVSELDDGALSDLRMEGNEMSAKVTVADDASPEIAMFTVPYSTGWTATVDGKPVEVMRADTAFMAVKVEGAGEHEIVFSFESPYLRTGAYLTLAGLLAFVAVCVFERRRRNV